MLYSFAKNWSEKRLKVNKEKNKKNIIPCPSCGKQLSYKKYHDDNILHICPTCGQIVLFQETKSLLDQLNKKTLFKKMILDKKVDIGLILIIIGLIFFNFLSPIYLKMAITLVIIGILLLFFTNRNSFSLDSWDDRMFIVMITWVLTMFILLSWLVNDELYFIIIYLGFLLIGDILGKFITVRLKKRLYIFIIFFLIIYILIIFNMMRIIG